MGAFIAMLAAEYLANWDICKKELLWGVPRSGHAENAAGQVTPGDTIFVWRSSSARAPGGLFARARATSRAVPAVNPPWPDHDRYSFVFSIEVTDELPVPIGDRFPGNRNSILFGLPNIAVNWGFGRISDGVERKMDVAFHRR